MDEFATLKLGGRTAAVQVRETAEQPQTAMVAAPAVSLADQLFADYTAGIPWPKGKFFARGGPDILQAVRLFTQKVNFARSERGEPLFNPIELEALVQQQAVYLASPLQLLCRWTVLVRVGVRKLQRDLLGLVAMLPLPAKGSIKLSKPADDVGKTHYVVTHLFGEHFACRGYTLHCDDAGKWLLGGTAGNRWYKDLWLTPGLQDINTIISAKRRKLQPRKSGQLPPHLQRVCDMQRAKLEAARGTAGLMSERFGAAFGARLDLENKAIMNAALACVRATLAQVLAYKADLTLDAMAARNGLQRYPMVENPDLVENEAESCRYHIACRDSLSEHFRSCGNFVIPRGHMVFATTNVPKTIPQEHRRELTGVTGIVVSADYLSTRYDVDKLKRSPAALPEIEDLSPLIDVCGIPTLDGSRVTNMQPVRDETGVECMRYSAGQHEPIDMPLDAFLKRTSVQFVPMVKNFNRRRLYGDDLQGEHEGVTFAMSHEDISGRFVCQGRKKPSRKSNS